jgi:hypothetical protein
VIILKKLPIRIRHFFLDSLRDAKMWYYAVIGKVVPVPLRNDYDVTAQERWLIEFSAIGQIQKRREKLLKTAKAICVHYVLPVLAGATVVLLIQSISTR